MQKIAFGSEQSYLTIGPTSIPCFILEDGQYVLLKNGIQKALGYDGKSENWLLDILNKINSFSSLPTDLLSSYEEPVLIKIPATGKPNKISEGIASKRFIETCKAIINAKNDGYLGVHQLKISKAAATILDYFNACDIDVLIEESTGYAFYKATIKDYLQRFLTETLQDDAFQWVKTFPENFFSALFEIHGLDWAGIKQQPHVVGKLIHEIVFSRISDELLAELRTSKPKRAYQTKNKKSRDLQNPGLKQHILSLLSLLETAGNNWNIFLQLLNRTHPKNPHFITRFPVFNKSSFKMPELTNFNQMLKKMS